MAKPNKFVSMYQKMGGDVDWEGDELAFGVYSSSPSVNFTYGNGTWVLPFGYSEVVFGPPKGGKTILTLDKIANLHKSDPDSVVMVFDTEGRWRAQLGKQRAQVLGIDLNRLMLFPTNLPGEIFDKISKEVPAAIEEGLNIKYIVIDSVSGIMGRREAESDSIENQQLGDQAQTVKVGLQRILGVIRKNKIALTLTTQLRSEMDAQIQRMTGAKTKMNAGFALQHFAEYFVYIEPIMGSAGRTDLSGNEFVNDTVHDLMDKAEKTGHRCRITMKNSTFGPKGRTGEFTIDYKHGLINQHEEVLRLGMARGVIQGKGAWLEYGGKKYNGKKDLLAVLQESPSMQQDIIKELKRREMEGDLTNEDQLVNNEDVPELE